jgi:hypothetical protein
VKGICALLLLAACGGAQRASSVSEADFLRTIPADTPYASVTLEPFPREYMDSMLRKQKGRAPQLSAKLEGREPWERLVVSFLRELEPYYSADGMERIGLRRVGVAAFYGLGILPAFRMQVTDPEKLTAFIERVIKGSGVAVPRETGGGHGYWAYRVGTASIVWAIDGNWLVGTIAPTSMLGEVLPRLFGDELPKRSLKDSGAIAIIGRSYGLSPVGVGFIDIQRLVAVVIDPRQEEDRRTLRALGLSVDVLQGDCATELASLAAEAPRLVFGFEGISVKSTRVRVTLDLPDKNLKFLSALRTPAAGVGLPLGSAVLRFGAAVDLRRAVDLAKLWAIAVKTRQYRCRELRRLNQLADEVSRELDVSIPAWLSPLRGGTLVAYQLQVSNLRGYGLITAADPLQVVGMLSAFIPQLGSINIPPDGTPVALPPGLGPIGHVALKGNVLGFSAGAGMEGELLRALAAPTPPSPPLLQLALDADALRAALGDMAGLADMSGKWDFRLAVDDRGLTLKFEELR